MGQPKPSIGRAAHYVSYGTPGGEYASECRAATITAVDDAPTQGAAAVSLCVMNPTGLFFNQGVKQDEDGHAGGAEFHELFATLVRAAAEQVHGDWHSAPNSPWQNACMCFEITPEKAGRLKQVLAEAAGEFGQDSIAWAVAETEFIGPGPAEKPQGKSFNSFRVDQGLPPLGPVAVETPIAEA